jgi:hypothetical protein
MDYEESFGGILGAIQVYIVFGYLRYRIYCTNLIRHSPVVCNDNLLTLYVLESDIKGATKDSWTPSITIPEPFSMTVREENNPRGPKHSRASLGKI